MLNFGLLVAEIVSGVWGTPATFNGFRVLAALLHGTPAAGSAKLAWCKEWNYGTFAEGVTYIRLGGHHVWHRPTF